MSTPPNVAENRGTRVQTTTHFGVISLQLLRPLLLLRSLPPPCCPPRKEEADLERERQAAEKRRLAMITMTTENQKVLQYDAL